MRSMFKFLILGICCFYTKNSEAQFTYLPISTFTNYHLDRLDISGQMPTVFTSIKPISRMDFAKINYVGVNENPYKYSKKYFNIELFEYPLYDSIKEMTTQLEVAQSPWKQFKQRIYATSSAMYSQKMSGLTLMINPILGFGGGKDIQDGTTTHQLITGAEIRGMVDNKVGFYSMFTKNQFRFAEYYNQIIDSNRVIPGEGYHVKEAGKTEAFLQARGYLTFSPVKHIGIQLGHDRNFIGNGYRSLLLSNFSKEYFFCKINTKIWRFNYQNLYTKLADYDKQSATGKGIKPKFMVNHYLGIKLFKNLDIGLFESVVFNRTDSTKNGQFDLNYINPIIFYTSIERNLNSGDNVIVGFDWKWNFLKRFSFYGQIVIDEFSKKEVVKRTGWWANKFGSQTGIKYINAFTIKGLDLLAEYNIVRPYTYSHFKRSQNYVNYNEPLAHPFGANFKEMVFLIKYQPFYKLFVEAGFISGFKGLDSSSKTLHYGGNILETYLKRPYEKGHFIGQGVETTYHIIWINLSYMVYQNVWIDARANIRNVKSTLSKFDSHSQWFQLGVRCNLNMRNYDF